MLRLVNFYLTPAPPQISTDDPAAFAFRLKEFEEQVTDYGGTVTIAPEVWEHLAHVGHRQERERRSAPPCSRSQRRARCRWTTCCRRPLYPFQLLGVLFLAFTERALLGDDMGLGKTVQALGAAHLLREQRGIGRVLVICPASVKRQWAREIARFSGLPATVIGGSKARRARQYADPGVFPHRQLRTGAARLRDDLGPGARPDHPGRGAADQELAGQDHAAHQRVDRALRLRAHRHAAGKPAGRAIQRRRVSRSARCSARPGSSSPSTWCRTSGARWSATKTWRACATPSRRSSCAAARPTC